MRVLVTGGTGTIGSSVVAELLAHGHTVVALARSESSAVAVKDAGAEPLRGSITDLDVLRAGAADAGGVVHLAFGSDYSSEAAIAQAVEEDAAAQAALGDALAGTGRPLVTVSGTPWIPGRPATEEDPLPTDGVVGGRGRTVNALLARAGQGVRVSAVRMPRTVHDRGTGGFAGLLTELARRTGVSGYLGDGSQRWPAVHARDAAALFRLALENAPAGTAWHAVDDEGDTMKDIATVIGRRLDLPVRALPDQHFGPFAPIYALDQPASSAHTRAALGWQPSGPRLLDDLENIAP